MKETSVALVGTWALQSFTMDDLESGQATHLFGRHPSGFLSYGPDRRMYAILANEARSAPAALVPTDAERIELFDGFFAYAGAYTVDGDKVSHHIDVSSNQAWTGTTQVRQFNIDGADLSMRSMPAKDGSTGRLSSYLAIWTKASLCEAR